MKNEPNDLQLAKEAYAADSDRYCGIVCRNGQITPLAGKGVSPLLDLLDAPGQRLKGAAVADKIIGKASAWILVSAGAAAVYTPVMSRGAEQIFRRFGIRAEYDVLTDRIIRRDGNGTCPMELAVGDIDSAEEAVAAVRRRRQELRREMQPEKNGQTAES